jgi:hypothetical protein
MRDIARHCETAEYLAEISGDIAMSRRFSEIIVRKYVSTSCESGESAENFKIFRAILCHVVLF